MSASAESLDISVTEYMRGLGRGARAAARVLSIAETQTKNRALVGMAESLGRYRVDILAENSRDLDKPLYSVVILYKHMNAAQSDAMSSCYVLLSRFTVWTSVTVLTCRMSQNHHRWTVGTESLDDTGTNDKVH